MNLRSCCRTSLYRFLGPQGSGSQPKRMDFGNLSHSNLLILILSVVNSISPNLLLTSVIVIHSDHCYSYLLEIPRIIMCDGMSSVSCCVSPVVSSILLHTTAQAEHRHYTISFYGYRLKVLSINTAFFKAPKAFEACANRLSTSTSICPNRVTRDPR